MRTSYRVIKTDVGHVGYVATPRGLARVFLPAPSAGAARAAIRRAFPDATEDDRLLPKLGEQLCRYFGGQLAEFNVPLDLADARPFLRDVWRACRRVGYGRTTTYQALAERVGRPAAARAVGQAMRKNPFPIVVPCHRVVRKDGGLGGYGGPQGTGLKQRLLELEAGADTPARADRRKARLP